jgi:CMP-N,N'-diacetyllegionaminic acid synthase
MNILGIIPAREGSKRVPQKNFRVFADTTLTDIAINQALGSKLISTIVISSDSTDVLAIAKKYDQVIPLLRPKELSNDHSPSIDYIRHTLSVLEKEQNYDLVVIIQPSSPLRSSKDIDNTIKLLIDNPKADSAVSIVKVSHMVHPLKLKTLQGNILLPFIEDENGRFASNDLPDIYVRNCAVYASWRIDMETKPDIIGNKSLGYLMPAETSVDINDMIDFEFAEYLFKK